MSAARLTARALLATRCVHLRPEEPFTLASGLLSPTYVDVRRLIGFPRERAAVLDAMADLVRDRAGALDVVAGGETAGIPFAAWLAERLELPMAYVRKKPKGYGRDARIEGPLAPRQRVLLVEDLITDGGSKLGFLDALREAGATCGHVAVVFSYGLPEAEARLRDNGAALHALAAWPEVLAAARDSGALDSRAIAEVEDYLRDPSAWRATRGRG